MKRPSPPETGSDTLSETPPCTHRIRSTNPTPLGPAHESQQLSQPMVVVDSLVLIHLSPRIDHKICMVINRLNHHYETEPLSHKILPKEEIFAQDDLALSRGERTEPKEKERILNRY